MNFEECTAVESSLTDFSDYNVPFYSAPATIIMRSIVKSPDKETVAALVRRDSVLQEYCVKAAFTTVSFLLLFLLGVALFIIMLVILLLVVLRTWKLSLAICQCNACGIGTLLIVFAITFIILGNTLTSEFAAIMYVKNFEDKDLVSRLSRHQRRSLCTLDKIITSADLSGFDAAVKAQRKISSRVESLMLSNGLEKVLLKKSTLDSALKSIPLLHPEINSKYKSEIQRFMSKDMSKRKILKHIRKVTDAYLVQTLADILHPLKKQVREIVGEVIAAVRQDHAELVLTIFETTLLIKVHLMTIIVLLYLMGINFCVLSFIFIKWGLYNGYTTMYLTKAMFASLDVGEISNDGTQGENSFNTLTFLQRCEGGSTFVEACGRKLAKSDNSAVQSRPTEVKRFFPVKAFATYQTAISNMVTETDHMQTNVLMWSAAFTGDENRSSQKFLTHTVQVCEEFKNALKQFLPMLQLQHRQVHDIVSEEGDNAKDSYVKLIMKNINSGGNQCTDLPLAWSQSWWLFLNNLVAPVQGQWFSCGLAGILCFASFLVLRCAVNLLSKKEHERAVDRGERDREETSDDYSEKSPKQTSSIFNLKGERETRGQDSMYKSKNSPFEERSTYRGELSDASKSWQLRNSDNSGYFDIPRTNY
ncbi:unnamed protein product [Cylicocyclus nassatus]|uniref:Uncharacterized protein n=1 Tax=Cylicocyclus nassatus TaxID=53992 RepID=A0AA36M4W6_CYLNA|nr:unnamed protein product [Cylicocyclus nassatus]